MYVVVIVLMVVLVGKLLRPKNLTVGDVYDMIGCLMGQVGGNIFCKCSDPSLVNVLLDDVGSAYEESDGDTSQITFEREQPRHSVRSILH